MTHNLPRLIQLIMTDESSRARVLSGASEDECISLAMDIAARNGIQASESDLRAIYDKMKPKPAELSDEELESVVGGKSTGMGATWFEGMFDGSNEQATGLIEGTDGDDVMTGEVGNEIMMGGEGDDHMTGSSHNWDREALESLGAEVPDGATQEDLNALGEGYAKMFGVTDNDIMHGEEGNDTMLGGLGDDTMYGGADNDFLSGGSGNDVLDGGTGNDRLDGGRGDDVLTGGEGSDTFVFDARDGNDTITDFTPGEDLIELEGCTSQNDFTVAYEDGNTVITYGETTITVQGQQLSSEDVWSMQQQVNTVQVDAGYGDGYGGEEISITLD